MRLVGIVSKVDRIGKRAPVGGMNLLKVRVFHIDAIPLGAIVVIGYWT